MDALKIVESVLKTKNGNLQPEQELSVLSRFMWRLTMSSIASIPESVKPVSISNKNLETEINGLLEKFNQERKTQISLYKKLVDQLINFR